MGLKSQKSLGLKQTAGGSGASQTNNTTILPNISGAVDEEAEQMHNLKAEFVEYVKEILTKTTSQVSGSAALGQGGGGKRTQKLSQMNMIEEVTYFLREGRENRQRVINNISIPELLKQTSKKEAAKQQDN